VYFLCLSRDSQFPALNSEVIMTATLAEPRRAAVRPQAEYFYVYMAVSCMAVAFLGFAPTYWAPLATGTFKARPLLHIHGIVFFSWTLYFVFQTWLAASG
jgi:hypothetical protein